MKATMTMGMGKKRKKKDEIAQKKAAEGAYVMYLCADIIQQVSDVALTQMNQYL